MAGMLYRAEPKWHAPGNKVRFYYDRVPYIGIVDFTSATFCCFKNLVEADTGKAALIDNTLPFVYIKSPEVIA